MKKVKLFLSIAAVGLLAMSCSKSEDPKPSSPATTAAPKPDGKEVSKTEAKASVNSSSSTMNSSIARVSSSKTVTTMNTLSQISGLGGGGLGGFRLSVGKSATLDVYKKLKISGIIKNLKKAKGAKIEDPDLEEMIGTYTYNFNEGGLDFAPGGSQIIVEFPDSANLASNSGKNNCKFILSDLEYFDYDNYGAEFPTKLNTQLSVDGTKLLAIEFTGAYNNDLQPTQYDSKVLVFPLQFSETFSSDYSTKASASAKLEDVELKEDIMGFKVDLTGDLESDNPDKIEGYIFLGDLALQGSINFAAFVDEEDPSQQLVDDNIKMKFKSYSTGDVYGEIKFDIGEEKTYVEYSDNTKVTIEEFLAPFAELAESFEGVLGEDSIGDIGL